MIYLEASAIENEPVPESNQSVQGADIVKGMEDAITEGMQACAVIVIKELERSLENPAVAKYADKGVINYMAASGALAFAGRDIDSDGVGRLLEAAGIKPDPTLLSVVHMLRYKNHLVYVNAVYYMEFCGKEPTIDGVLAVVKAMDVAPDAMIAGYVLEYCKEFKAGKYAAISTSLKPSIVDPEIFKKLCDIVLNLAETMTELAIKELEKSLQNKTVQARMNKEIIPYVGAIGSLTFSGRDIDTGNIGRLVESVGVEPELELLRLMASLKLRNQLVYVIALYFLITVDVEPRLENLIKTVRAMDVAPDALVAGYVVAFYKMKKLTGGVKK